MIFSIEVTKDTRPQAGGQLEDTSGNLVKTGTASADGKAWSTAVTSLGGAVNDPSTTPVYAIDTLNDIELSKINSLTVDTSGTGDGSAKKIYRVSTIDISRPTPGPDGTSAA
eukprot:COSAG01_NODE_39059_length_481_cov_1.581152_1_plen_111_part_01